MITKISANTIQNNTYSNHRVQKEPAFTSKFCLVKNLELQEYSAKALRENFEAIIPTTKMDEFVSQVELIKATLEKDGIENRVLSLQPTKNEYLQFISSDGKSLTSYNTKGFAIKSDGISNLAKNAINQFKATL